MNRYIKFCIAVVLVVWIFCLGLVIGTFMVRHDFTKAYNDSLTTPTVLQYASEYDTQSQPNTTQIVIDIITNQATTQPETTTTEPSTEFSVNIDTGMGTD